MLRLVLRPVPNFVSAPFRVRAVHSLKHPTLLSATDSLSNCAADSGDGNSEFVCKLQCALIASAVLGVAGGCLAFKPVISSSDSSVVACDRRSIALSQVARDGISLKDFPEFQNDRDVVMASVRADGLALQFASPELKRRNDVVDMATLNNPLAFEFVGSRWKDKHATVLRVLRQASTEDVPRLLGFASVALQVDPGFVLRAALSNPSSLRSLPQEALQQFHLPNEWEDDSAALHHLLRQHEFISKALASDGSLLELLGQGHRSNAMLALAAIQSDKTALEHIDVSLSSDDDFLLRAVETNPSVLGALDASDEFVEGVLERVPEAVVHLPPTRAELHVDKAARALFSGVSRVNDEDHLCKFQHLLDSTYSSCASNDRKGRAVPKSFTVQFVFKCDNANLRDKHECYAQGIYGSLAELHAKTKIEQAQWLCDLKPRLAEAYKKSELEVTKFMSAPLATDVFLSDGMKGKGDWLPVSTGDRMLFHGTTFSASWKIVRNGFQLSSGMLGNAIYFSENITKADEHTLRDDRHWPALHTVILAKTVLGNIKVQEWGDRTANKRGYDCTQYNSQVGFGAFREFALAEKSGAMPMYIILYTRNY